MATAVIGLIFATLLTVGTVSLTFILNSDEELESDLRKEHFAFQDYMSRITRGTDFLKLASDAQGRELKRVQQFITLWQQKTKRREAFRSLSTTAIAGLTEDFGVLSGYSPDSTGVGPKYHETLHNYFQTELRIWQWVGKNRDYDFAGGGGVRGSKELGDLLLEKSFNERALSSSRTDSSFGQELRIRASKQQTEDLQAELTHRQHKFNLASWAFFSVVSVFFLAVFYLFEARRPRDRVPDKT